MHRKPLFWTLLAPLLAVALLPMLALGLWAWAAPAGAERGWGFVLLAGGGAALLAGGAAALLARALAAQVGRVREAAERLGSGELGTRVAVPGSRELDGLARAFNRMAGRLQQTLAASAQKQSELETVLAHMAEAVLVVDGQERVINLNPSAARLFGLRLEDVRGRYLMEVVRNADLIRFLGRTMAAPEAVTGQIALHREPEDRVLDAHGTLLRDAGGSAVGALLVLRDLTTLRKLEGMRKDFVANVSHELKSPLTAIQGFVETLQDGALDEPGEARRFLEIIARQVERLMAIVEDLLHLSRIEQEEERGEIELETLPLKPVLQAAIQDCEAKAADGSVRVELACEEALSADINAALLEQAVVNLLDNAIKYSADGREVRLSAMEQNGQLRISVQDHGKGIPARHLPRLFERFYRVDTARSRELGGTGLGLAIVKHIAQAHGGSVTVESRTGRGSTFAICLPR